MIANNANILGAVVQRDFTLFIKYIIQFALMQFPTSFVNNLLKHLIDTLALYFRERCLTMMDTLSQFSLQSLTIYLQSTQAHFAHASRIHEGLHLLCGVQPR